MTDARFPEQWLNDRRVTLLPDAAFRLFVTSLAWAVANRTDGVLYDDDLAMIPRADPDQAKVLAKARLWRRDRDRWFIVVFPDTQTTSAELESAAAARRANRERQARHRQRERERKAAGQEGVARDVTRDVTGYSTGQDRTGQDRHLGEATESEHCAICDGDLLTSGDITAGAHYECSRYPAGNQPW